MSAVADQVPASTTTDLALLPPPQRAAIVLKSAEREAELKALAAQHRDITTVTNAAGREQCHRALMTLRNARIDIQKIGKEARDDATKFGKAVIAEENRLVAIIGPEEDRLERLRDAWDQEQERIKEAEREKERQRVAAITAKIEAMRQLPAEAVGKAAVTVQAMIDALQEQVIDAEGFSEWAEHATAVRGQVIDKLRAIHAERSALEAEQERLRREREEADRRQQEENARLEAERTRLAQERARLEEQERQRQAEQQRIEAIKERIAELRGCQTLTATSGSALIRDHIADLEALVVDASFAEFEQEAAATKADGLARLGALLEATLRHEEQQEQLRLQRQQQEREEAEARERRAAEQKRLDDEREAFEAEKRRHQEEQERLADIKAAGDACERELDSLTDGNGEATSAAPESIPYPGDDAIEDALLARFGVSRATAQHWLSRYAEGAAA